MFSLAAVRCIQSSVTHKAVWRNCVVHHHLELSPRRHPCMVCRDNPNFRGRHQLVVFLRSGVICAKLHCVVAMGIAKVLSLRGNAIGRFLLVVALGSYYVSMGIISAKRIAVGFVSVYRDVVESKRDIALTYRLLCRPVDTFRAVLDFSKLGRKSASS